MIITNSVLNQELSKQVAGYFDNGVEPHYCYGNIYHFIKACIDNKIDISNIEIAYGYAGKPKFRMYRHCYLIKDGKEIIDPSIVLLKPESVQTYEYHTFKKFSYKEYEDMTKKHFENNPEELPMLNYITQEEKEYCDYAIIKGIQRDGSFVSF